MGTKWQIIESFGNILRISQPMCVNDKINSMGIIHVLSLNYVLDDVGWFKWFSKAADNFTENKHLIIIRVQFIV